MNRDPIEAYRQLLRTAYGRRETRPGEARAHRPLLQASSFDDGGPVAARIVRGLREYDLAAGLAVELPEYDVSAVNPDFRPPADLDVGSVGATAPPPPAPRRAPEVAVPALPAKTIGAGPSDREAPAERPARTAAEQSFTQRQLQGLISDDALRADLESIMRGKRSAAGAGRIVDVETRPSPPAAAARPPAAAGQRGELPQPGVASEHAIFDKIAENMRYATAYDLGSIDLQRRFDDFDRVEPAHRPLARSRSATNGAQPASARALARPAPPPAATPAAPQPAPAEATPVPHAGDPAWPPRPADSTFHTSRQRDEAFGPLTVEPDPSTSGGDGIRILGSWEADNLVDVAIPQLVGMPGIGARNTAGTVKFHRLGRDALVSLWREWEQAGLLDRIRTWEGSFVPRYIRGTSGESPRPVSTHAYGIAFDVNAAWNPLGTVPPPVGREGCVRELVEIANRNGFYWGGHFDRPDGMHFELARRG